MNTEFTPIHGTNPQMYNNCMGNNSYSLHSDGTIGSNGLPDWGCDTNQWTGKFESPSVGVAI